MVLAGCLAGPGGQDPTPPFTGDLALPHSGDVLEYDVRGEAPFLSPLVGLGYPAGAGDAVIRVTFAEAADRLDTHLRVRPSFVARFEAVGPGGANELGAAYLSRALPFGVLQFEDRSRLPVGAGTYHDVWDGTGPACFFGSLLQNASAEPGTMLRRPLAFNTGVNASQALELRVTGNETIAALETVIWAEAEETPHPYRIWMSDRSPCPVRVEGRTNFFDPASATFEVQLRSLRRGTGGPLAEAPADSVPLGTLATLALDAAGDRGFPPEGPATNTPFPLSEAWNSARALDAPTRDFLANHSAAFLAHAQRFQYTYMERWGVRWQLEFGDPAGAGHRVEIERRQAADPQDPTEESVSFSAEEAAPPAAGRAAVLALGRPTLTLASAERAFHALFPTASIETLDITAYGAKDVVRYSFRFNPRPEDPEAPRATLEFDATSATLVAFTGPDSLWAR